MISPPAKIFVTGGTGFVGQHMVLELISRGYRVAMLSRANRRAPVEFIDKVNLVDGDLSDIDNLRRGMSGCSAVIHLVGIIREFPRRGITCQKIVVEGTSNVVKAAKDAGIGRFVHMSAIGADPGGKTKLQTTKFEAEEIVRNSGIDFTIFRPSVIFGPGDQFVSMMAKMIRTSPIVPVIGDGKYRIQLVHVKNVVAGFAGALIRDETIGNTYPVGGPDAFEYNEILRIIMDVLGKKRLLIYVPKSIMYFMASLFQGIPAFPITTEQITALFREDIIDTEPFCKATGVSLIEFKQGIKDYLLIRA